MDLTQFLHGVILILRISDFKNLGLKFLYIDDVIITRLRPEGGGGGKKVDFPVFTYLIRAA